MPLTPEDNPLYWPLLLTDELYLLPHDLREQASTLTIPGEAKTAETPQATNVAISTGATAAPAQPAEAPREQAQPDLIWGSLQKGLLILVDYPQHPLMERTDGLFLVDILKAVGFDFKEVATLNVQRCKTAADWQYVRNLSFTWVLSFGVQHKELPFTQQQATYQTLNEGSKVIMLAESLSTIRVDVSRKKLLWNLLKGCSFK